jgi:hypothetical protein
MHRRVAALVAMMAALVLSAAPVAAEPNPAFNRAVSGPVVGTTFVDFLTSGCGLVHQTVDGTYTTAKGETGSFHLDMCPTFGVDSGSVEVGSFTLRDPRGSTLDGTVTGVYDTSTPPNIPFEFTLHAVTGTRLFRHARGTITLAGVWEFVAIPSPISGALVGSLGP